MKNKVSFILNNQAVEIEGSPFRRLLDVLREDLGMTGTKEGCGEGECGACSVLVDGELINSCLFPVIRAENKEVLTIEGFKESPRYDVLKEPSRRQGRYSAAFAAPG